MRLNFDPTYSKEFVKAVNAVLPSDWKFSSEGPQENWYVEYEYLKPNFSKERVLISICREKDSPICGCYVSGVYNPSNEYNDVIMDFHDNVIRNLKVEFEFSALLFETPADMEDYMPYHASKYLMRFALLTEKTQEGMKFANRKHWFEFLAAINSEKDVRLRSKDLMDFLMRIEWPEDMAKQLAYEFDLSKEIFKMFRNKKVMSGQEADFQM